MEKWRQQPKIKVIYLRISIKYTFIALLLFPEEFYDFSYKICHSVGAGRPPKTAGGHEGGPATERLDKIQNVRVPPGLAEGGFQLLHGRDVPAEVAGSLKGGEPFQLFDWLSIDAKFCALFLA